MRKISAALEMCNAYNITGGLVNFDTFKKIRINDRTANGGYTRNALIASITKIEDIISDDGEDMVRVEFGHNGSLGILILDSYNSRMKKLRGPWRGYGCNYGTKGKGNHIIVTIQNVDLSMESLLLIIDDIRQDCLLLSYQDVNANVLDGTGSINNLWHTKPNMNIENIEWCLPADNLRHGRNIAYMKDCCNGECYAFSAHDGQLLAMLELRDMFTRRQVHLYVKQHFKRTL